MLRAVNLSLAERRIEAQFVSLIYAVWGRCTSNTSGGELGLGRVPFMCHAGKNHVIEATGLPLGLFDDANYDEFRFKNEAGGYVLFSSATAFWTRVTAAEQLFGRGRVEHLVAECADKSADCVVNTLFKAVAEHSAGVESFDDQNRGGD